VTSTGESGRGEKCVGETSIGDTSTGETGRGEKCVGETIIVDICRRDR
jgi:hypothetical protein